MSFINLRALGLVALTAASCSNAVEPGPAAANSSGGQIANAGTSTTAGGDVTALAGSGGVGARAGADTGGASARAGTGGSAGSGVPGVGGSSAGQASGGSVDGETRGCVGLFCEDFESGALDSAVWTVKANGGQTMKVQADTAAHGKYAAQFHGMPNVVSYDFIIASHVPTALNGHHFGRAYFQVTPKPPQKHTELLFAGTSGFPKLKYLEVAESDLGWQLTYVQLADPTGESYTPSIGTVPLAKWACLQWEMNDTPDQIRLSVDGMSAATFDDINYMSKKSGLVGGFTDFGFGFYIWHPATYAFDVYYDDIVLDTKPIPCLE